MIKKYIKLGIITLISLHASSEFNMPWKMVNKAIIIDPYYANNMDFDKIKRDTDVIAIIHKASQGNRIDSKYKERRKIAKNKGYLWGSYHLGTNKDPIKQAKFYLKTIDYKNHPNDLLALDIEGIGGNNISLQNAKKFITYIVKETKHYPFIYANEKVTKEIIKNSEENDILLKCPLWYARFIKNIDKSFPKKQWKTYTIWQFSSEIEVQYKIPGTDNDIDINIYNGTKQQLKENWPLMPKNETIK